MQVVCLYVKNLKAVKEQDLLTVYHLTSMKGSVVQEAGDLTHILITVIFSHTAECFGSKSGKDCSIVCQMLSWRTKN